MSNTVDFMATLENMAVAMQATTEVLGQHAGNENGGHGKSAASSAYAGGSVCGVCHVPFGRKSSILVAMSSLFTAARVAKELELLQLKQGSMIVTEYTNKFEELCRFLKVYQGAPDDYEEWKCIKYEGGLRDYIMSTMLPIKIRSFSELVNKS
ncbi:hypothetical protein AHAS_Ahas17G0214800 [Arachis hypogaea]